MTCIGPVLTQKYHYDHYVKLINEGVIIPINFKGAINIIVIIIIIIIRQRTNYCKVSSSMQEK